MRFIESVATTRKASNLHFKQNITAEHVHFNRHQQHRIVLSVAGVVAFKNRLLGRQSGAGELG